MKTAGDWCVSGTSKGPGDDKRLWLR